MVQEEKGTVCDQGRANSLQIDQTGFEIRQRGQIKRVSTQVLCHVVALRGDKETDGAQSGSGRDISAIFMELPDRKDIPDYYRTIKNPISLEEIEVCSASAPLNGYAD